MAKPGRKGKSPVLREMQGNPGHRPIHKDALLEVPNAIGPPPKHLQGRQREMWKQWIEGTPWLDDKDIPAALAYLTICEKIEEGKGLKTSEHITFRYLSNMLGMNPGARADMAAQRTRARNAGSQPAPDKMSSLIGKKIRREVEEAAAEPAETELKDPDA